MNSTILDNSIDLNSSLNPDHFNTFKITTAQESLSIDNNAANSMNHLRE